MKNKIFLLFIILVSGNYLNSQWQIINNNLTSEIRSVHFFDLNNGYAAAYNSTDSIGRLYKTFDGGSTWFITLSQSKPIYKVYSVVPNEIFTVGENKVWLTTDNGNQWSEWNFGPYELYDICFQNSSFIYVSGYNQVSARGVLIRSVNRGVSWTFTFSFENANKLFCVRFPTNLVGYSCGQNGTLKKVIEGVTNWNNQYTGTTENLFSMHFMNADTGFIAGANSTLLKTTNGGSPWFTVQTGFPNINFRFIKFVNNYEGFIVGDNGFIIKSTNGGTNWFQQSSPVTSNLYSLSVLNRDTLFITGSNGTLLKTYNSGNPTGINTISNIIPENFFLGQNYPNPFNPVTNIKFNLAKNCFVELIIYDQTGKEVETLINREMITGEYSVNWNASMLTSGVYFYQLKAGEFTETKKMVLIK